MQLSKLFTLITIVFLSACANASAEERSASSQQRYTIHVPTEVKFGQMQLPAVKEAVNQNATAVADSLVFMAETTSGLTIQFETRSATPLQLTVGERARGNWWANQANDLSGSTRELVVAATSVQATTLGAGWTTLKLDVAGPPAAADESITTIVVTIVAH